MMRSKISRQEGLNDLNVLLTPEKHIAQVIRG